MEHAFWYFVSLAWIFVDKFGILVIIFMPPTSGILRGQFGFALLVSLSKHFQQLGMQQDQWISYIWCQHEMSWQIFFLSQLDFSCRVQPSFQPSHYYYMEPCQQELENCLSLGHYSWHTAWLWCIIDHVLLKQFCTYLCVLDDLINFWSKFSLFIC